MIIAAILEQPVIAGGLVGPASTLIPGDSFTCDEGVQGRAELTGLMALAGHMQERHKSPTS